MKMRKLIAVGGSPGTGKTTLFREFLKEKPWRTVEPAKLISALYCDELDLYVLGKYEEGETFAGTDRLSMAVQPPMQEWIASHTSNILFEGDRIFNQSFLEFATRLPNTDLQIVILTAPKTVLEQRYRDRGSNQSETFLKGRETKYDKIQSNFELISYIKEFPNATHEDQQRVLTFLDAQLVHKIL
jgi:broad-specificity NMP kinase